MQAGVYVKYDFQEILSNFWIEDTCRTVVPLGSGLINDTYSVKYSPSDSPLYLLQKINSRIFKDVPALMQNIVNVTSHIWQKLGAHEEARGKVLQVVMTKNGASYYQDITGDYWRIFHYIPNTMSFDKVETEQQAFEGGLAFGQFQFLLSDLEVSEIVDSIPNFHNISVRLEQLYAAFTKDPVQRAKEISTELLFISEREERMKKILLLGNAGRIPKRVIHSDTKFNNILFSKDGRVQCVVDLDTVMAGYSAYDFGDAIRTIINSAGEDERDLEKIRLNSPLFRAYTRGYLSQAIHFLEEEELKSLMDGVLLLPYMQAVRFLTDYLDGDCYYKVRSEKHNLERTLAQIQLVKKLEESYDYLAGIIEEEAEILMKEKAV